MATASKNQAKKNPVTPSRDQVIAMVLELGGEAERKRYEKIEGLERTHGQGDVIHYRKVGDILGESFAEHDEETIRVYSVGLQRAPQTLRLSVRLAQLYTEPEIRELLKGAMNAGHELNWAHFRQLLREGLSETQREDLAARVVKHRWGYRELEMVITGILGGKKSQGGRKPGKTKYKTYAGALSAMKMRSRAWLALEEDWIGQVKTLASKLDEDEKYTAEFLELTTAAAKQLRDVADKADRDAGEAEAIAAEVRKVVGDPELREEAAPPATNGALKPKGKTAVTAKLAPGFAKAAKAAEAAPKGKPKAKPKAKAMKKPKAKAKPRKRVRLARHPKMVDGKFVDEE